MRPRPMPRAFRSSTLAARSQAAKLVPFDRTLLRIEKRPRIGRAASRGDHAQDTWYYGCRTRGNRQEIGDEDFGHPTSGFGRRLCVRRHLTGGARRRTGTSRDALILATDVSGSVNATRYKTQQEGYLEALGDPRVLGVVGELEPPVLAIMFIAWSRGQEVMVPWMRVHDTQSMDLFRNRLKNIHRPPDRREYSDQQSAAILRPTVRPGLCRGRKVIDISGDGDDNQGIFGLHQVRDGLVAKGIVINGLPIVVKPPEYIFPPQPPEGLDVYYRNHVVGGAGHVSIEINRVR